MYGLVKAKYCKPLTRQDYEIYDTTKGPRQTVNPRLVRPTLGFVLTTMISMQLDVHL